MKREQEPEGRIRGLKVAAMLSTIGLTLAISIGLGIGLGILLDRWLGTNWIVIVGTLLGVIAGFQQMIRAVIRANAEQEALEVEERRRGEQEGRSGRDG